MFMQSLCLLTRVSYKPDLEILLESLTEFLKTEKPLKTGDVYKRRIIMCTTAKIMKLIRRGAEHKN